MERTPETIEKMVEILFTDCLFDPMYMDEDFTKSQLRLALEFIPETDWDWIISKYKEELQ